MWSVASSGLSKAGPPVLSSGTFPCSLGLRAAHCASPEGHAATDRQLERGKGTVENHGSQSRRWCRTRESPVVWAVMSTSQDRQQLPRELKSLVLSDHTSTARRIASWLSSLSLYLRSTIGGGPVQCLPNLPDAGCQYIWGVVSMYIAMRGSPPRPSPPQIS